MAVSEAQLDGPPDEASGVICGAVNFAVGDRVALALPGAVLPGGFEIGARRTYGHISEGMICSASELALGDDHTGILVLPPDAPLGEDFVAYAGLRDEVFEIAVTPDRGYAVSVRGLARELASAYGVPFTDPAATGCPMRPCGRTPWTSTGAGGLPGPASTTRPPATGSCCARCAASRRRAHRRCGCGCGWPGAACGRSRSPST